ncbi:MAG: hypothetical protein ACREFP_21785 [Acetobacteraceae bacterium]
MSVIETVRGTGLSKHKADQANTDQGYDDHADLSDHAGSERG